MSGPIAVRTHQELLQRLGRLRPSVLDVEWGVEHHPPWFSGPCGANRTHLSKNTMLVRSPPSVYRLDLDTGTRRGTRNIVSPLCFGAPRSVRASKNAYRSAARRW